METEIKHLIFDLGEENYRINVLITLVPETIIINGTGRLEYLISIPEWGWSISVAKVNCPYFYWENNLEGNIDNSLKKYIEELSISLSGIYFNILFGKGIN